MIFLLDKVYLRRLTLQVYPFVFLLPFYTRQRKRNKLNIPIHEYQELQNRRKGFAPFRYATLSRRCGKQLSIVCRQLCEKLKLLSCRYPPVQIPPRLYKQKNAVA